MRKDKCVQLTREPVNVEHFSGICFGQIADWYTTPMPPAASEALILANICAVSAALMVSV